MTKISAQDLERIRAWSKKGLSPKFMARELSVCVGTIQYHVRKFYDLDNCNRLMQVLQRIIDVAKTEEDLKLEIRDALNFKELCALKRIFHLYPSDNSKDAKINALVKYLKPSLIIGVIPVHNAHYSQKDLKRAYYRKAKKVHPDKGGNAKDFIKLTKIYEELRAI